MIWGFGAIALVAIGCLCRCLLSAKVCRTHVGLGIPGTSPMVSDPC